MRTEEAEMEVERIVSIYLVGLAIFDVIALLGFRVVCRSLRSELADFSRAISERCCTLETPIRDEERRQAMLRGIERVRR